jgi:hypothetical protein
MRFDDDVNEQDIESLAKTETDVHIQVTHMPINDSKYARNPFGDRDGDVNCTLYFDDGERSVDYVLVWKKLVPNDDGDNEKEKEDLKKREQLRAERREVFEENLVNEGLELERYVVDDEITFVKIHAPLEVLRRYAEILKLRMPMKLVSYLFSRLRMIISLIYDSCGKRRRKYTLISVISTSGKY